MIRTEFKAESEAESLSTNIDNSLLRGVPASLVLRGFGASLRTREFRQVDYLQSSPVNQLDDFISHDWASGWCGKTFALCLLYNSWPAAVASLSVGLVLAALQSKLVGVLPTVVYITRLNQTGPFGFICEIVCPIVFVIFFIFWQDIRQALCLRATMVFLDKYCIDQEDEYRKAAGIAGLGGFLRYTDRLVICWTPRYLTRLWCTYEMASWLYLQKPMHHVEFLPLSHAKGIILLCVTSATVGYLYACVMVWRPSLELPLLVCALGAVNLVGAHLLRRLVREVRQLPEQFAQFSVANAGCFCCENNHCLPGNSTPSMACDRMVVYETLKGWFQDDFVVDRVSSHGLLSDFDREVREFFGPWVLRKAGPTELPYKLIALSGLPYLFRGLDSLVFIDREVPAVSLRRSLIEYPTLAFAILPVAYKSALHFITWVDSRVGIPGNLCLDVLITVVCSMCPGGVCILLWAPMTLGNNESLAWGLIFAGVDAMIAAVLFRRDLARWRLLACMGWSPPEAVPPRTGVGWRARSRSRRRANGSEGGATAASEPSVAASSVAASREESIEVGKEDFN